jgi:cell shape-determining protein MreD
LLASFGIGAIQDLLSAQAPGLYALSYGLLALFVTSAQSMVYREHPLTHFSLALFGGLISMVVLLVHDWIAPSSPRVADGKMILPAIHLSVATLFAGVLYTAVLSPLIIGGLQRLKGMWAFKPQRRRARPW